MGKLFDVSIVFSSIPKLLRYLPVSLEITMISMLFGLFLGLLFAAVRIKRIPVLRTIAAFFVSFIRGTPLIVQLYISYYVIPLILKYINFRYGTAYSLKSVPDMLFVIIAFSFNEAAYNSEILRAALLSVQKGQIEAAESLGMSGFQVFRRVILPQASVVAIPPLGNAFIGLLKGTSLAFVAGVIEMTAAGRIISGNNFRFFEVYLALAIVYWALTILIERLATFLEKRVSIPEQVSEGAAKPKKGNNSFLFFSGGDRT
ncbi:amino acid ABC transporter permease [Spirochaetia bacterium]|nr:amino acid ABC transporter permease [Spirochaetia bacterium]